MEQITDTILMIRPNSFRSNEETATDNYFQEVGNDKEISSKAQQEFDAFVRVLRKHNVNVIVSEPDPSRDTPDELFPNNWISFHENDEVVLYPMYAENRRRERDLSILSKEEFGHHRNWKITNYASIEEHDMFLEGTGSMILDRVHRKAYCCLSNRSNLAVVKKFCEDFDYEPITFKAYQTHEEERKLIYHTNVMLSIGEDFAIICADSIDDSEERKKVIDSLEGDSKTIILITEEQVASFAGNILQLKNVKNERLLIMSEKAYQSLDEQQLRQLSRSSKIVTSAFPTIEKYGGGSARCMLAEIF